MEQTIQDAFRAMQMAYEKFLKESEELLKKNQERAMNLPPTLGKTN